VADGEQMHDDQLLKSFRKQRGARKDRKGDQVSGMDPSLSHEKKEGGRMKEKMLKEERK